MSGRRSEKEPVRDFKGAYRRGRKPRLKTVKIRPRPNLCGLSRLNVILGVQTYEADKNKPLEAENALTANFHCCLPLSFLVVEYVLLNTVCLH